MTTPCMALDPSGTQPASPPYLVRGAVAVLTRVQIVLQTVRGTWPDDVALGVLSERVRLGQASAVEVEGIVRSQLRRIAGVLSVERVTVRIATDASIGVVVTVRDEDGTAVRAAVGDVDDVTARRIGAWYAFLSTVSPVVVR